MAQSFDGKFYTFTIKIVLDQRQIEGRGRGALIINILTRIEEDFTVLK